MRTLVLGYAKVFLTMFIKKKKNRSGTISIVVAEKTKGSYKELVTIGIAKDANDIDSLVNDGREWISKEESRRHPQLDLYGEIDAILLTGGMAHSDYIISRLKERISFLAPVHVYPGEDEMEALALNALGALRGELPIQEYK